MGQPMQELYDTCARDGAIFAHKFFKDVDSIRESRAVLPNTKFVWNGLPGEGTAPFKEILSRTPPTHHEISGLDAQPFPNGDRQALNMLINLSGKVKIGEDKTNVFAWSAQLVARRTAPKDPLVLHTIGYRLVHRNSDCTLKF